MQEEEPETVQCTDPPDLVLFRTHRIYYATLVFLIAFAEAPLHSSCINSLVISEFLLKVNRMASAEARDRFPPQSGPLINRTRLEDGVRGDWD